MIRRHFHTSFFTINKSRSQPRGTRLLAVVVIAVSGLLVGVVCQFISNHAKFSFGGVLTDPKKPISCCFMDNDIHGSGLVLLGRSTEVVVRADYDDRENVIAGRIIETAINSIGTDCG